MCCGAKTAFNWGSFILSRCHFYLPLKRKKEIHKRAKQCLCLILWKWDVLNSLAFFSCLQLIQTISAVDTDEPLVGHKFVFTISTTNPNFTIVDREGKMTLTMFQSVFNPLVDLVKIKNIGRSTLVQVVSAVDSSADSLHRQHCQYLDTERRLQPPRDEHVFPARGYLRQRLPHPE